ncbi:hypothetical protein JYU34_017739, partial [Plutella xylostella]
APPPPPPPPGGIRRDLRYDRTIVSCQGQSGHPRAFSRELGLRDAPGKDEPASSGDSGDESGSEPESPADKHRDWALSRSPDEHREPQASTSSIPQEADSSKSSGPMTKMMPKIDLPGGAMLYHPGVLAQVGLDGLGSNLGYAMGLPHSFILGLAGQGQDGAPSSSSAPSMGQQFITIPLSMAMAAANNGHAGASSDDSSELQDLSTGARK